MLKLQGVDPAFHNTATRHDKLLAQKAVDKLQNFLVRKYQSIVLVLEAPSRLEEDQACQALEFVYPPHPIPGGKFGGPLVVFLWDTFLSLALSDFLKRALLPKKNALTAESANSLFSLSVLAGNPGSAPRPPEADDNSAALTGSGGGGGSK